MNDLINAFNAVSGQTFLGALRCYKAIEFVFEPGESGFNLVTLEDNGNVMTGFVDLELLESYGALRK